MFDYRPRPNLLEDHSILITGAGGAIGGAAARAFAAHGATAILLGRSQVRLEQTYDAIVAAGHAEPVLCPLDLASATPADYQRVAAAIDRQFGRLDGLLHAAAMLGSLTPIEHYDPGLWSRVLQVNLTAPWLLTQACLPLLKKSPAASVIFSADAVGRHGRAYWGAFGAAHAGVENLAMTLADEVEANTRIRVNSLDPGPLRSRLRALAFPGEDPNTLPGPESVMPAYLYLMGADSRTLTGRRLSLPDVAALLVGQEH
jgi:NAD(P)-dependent dehydrogenase (short-subunit alcohol dehydrogenase family)